jgi:hypothetical protein
VNTTYVRVDASNGICKHGVKGCRISQKNEGKKVAQGKYGGKQACLNRTANQAVDY